MLHIFTSYPEGNVQATLQPWQLFLLILAGWVNRRQQDPIDYLLTENRVLREKLGKKRILPNDDRRRRLAVKGKILGRKMLEQLAASLLQIRSCVGIGSLLRGIGTSAGGGRT